MTAKGKGNKFENDCCKLFQRWYGKKFIRVPLSGGWKETTASGDIICVNEDKTVDESFPFSVECKFQENWDFIQLFKGTGKILNEFWKQAVRDCPPSKQPLLIFTKTGAPVFVCIYYSASILNPNKKYTTITRIHPAHEHRLIIIDWFSFTQILPKEKAVNYINYVSEYAKLA